MSGAILGGDGRRVVDPEFGGRPAAQLESSRGGTRTHTTLPKILSPV